MNGVAQHRMQLMDLGIMEDKNRKITIEDPTKKNGVILESKFGEKSDPNFEKKLNELKVKYQIIKS